MYAEWPASRDAQSLEYGARPGFGRRWGAIVTGVAYLANVGTRDILLDGKPLPWPRPDGADLLSQYETVRSRLDAPILLPGLHHVLGLVHRVDLVVLFASDQPDPPATREDFWKRDTIHLGRILAQFLQDRLAGRVGRVECRPIPHDPSSHDHAVRFYSNELPILVPPAEYDAVWLAPIGGVDACNMGLTLNAVRLYRRNCQAIYVNPMGHVQTLELHKDILGGYAREEGRAHLSRRDFPALRRTLDVAHLGKPWQLPLCDYADARLRFDFQAADAAIEKAVGEASGAEEKARIRRCRGSLTFMLLLNEGARQQPDSTSAEMVWGEWLKLQRSRLTELYFNLRLKAERGEWVDFLGRLFRLYEAALRLCFEMETRHSTEKHGDGFPDFEKAIRSDTDVLAYFEEKGVSWQQPDNHVLRMWLEARVRKDGKKLGQVRGALNKIHGLSELRNKSILAHGYQGVGRDVIEARLKGQSVLDFIDADLRGVLSALDVPVTPADDWLAGVVSLLEV